MTKLELTLTKLRERAVILRQGRWSDGPEDAELMEHAADAIEQLERKNAKLRELVLCLLTCSSDTGDACDRCPVNGGAGIWDFEDFCDSLLDRVHELRIELNA